MSRDEVVAKARDLIGPVLGVKKAERLIAAVLDVDTLADVRALRPLLQKS
jgi:hypothetical protein